MLNFTEHFLQMLKGQVSAFYPHSHYEFFSDNELTSRITESTVAMCPDVSDLLLLTRTPFTILNWIFVTNMLMVLSFSVPIIRLAKHMNCVMVLKSIYLPE